MNYLVLDLETANGDCASICQLGIVTVENGAVVGTAAHFVDPEADFDPWNIRIHGIGPEHVRSQPTWPELFTQVAALLTDSIVVTHGCFDRVAITRACERYGLGTIPARWLDNQRVVRRTWPIFAKKGYALDNLARHFGIPLRHHDALEDAIATEKVFRLALRETGLTASAWCEEIERPRLGASTGGVERRGPAEGAYAGQTIVFTGRLSVSRSKAADLAAVQHSQPADDGAVRWRKPTPNPGQRQVPRSGAAGRARSPAPDHQRGRVLAPSLGRPPVNGTAT